MRNRAEDAGEEELGWADEPFAGSDCALWGAW